MQTPRQQALTCRAGRLLLAGVGDRTSGGGDNSRVAAIWPMGKLGPPTRILIGELLMTVLHYCSGMRLTEVRDTVKKVKKEVIQIEAEDYVQDTKTTRLRMLLSSLVT